MKAITLDEYGAPDVLRYCEQPIPSAGPGEILIRVHAVGVNPADVKWRCGMFSGAISLSFPHIPGYDVAGIVESPGDTGFAVGTRVAAILHSRGHGGYAEVAQADAVGVAEMVQGLDFVRAAAIPTPGLTGLQMIDEQLDVQNGQTLLITGATGAVGRAAVYAAKARSVRIIAAVREAYRERALALGADAVIRLGEEDWHGAPFDHVADTVGGASVAALCRHLKPGGKIRTAATIPIPSEGLTATPTFFAVRRDRQQLARLLEAIAVGEIEVAIAQVIPLSDAAQAHRLVEGGKVTGKIVLQP